MRTRSMSSSSGTGYLLLCKDPAGGGGSVEKTKRRCGKWNENGQKSKEREIVENRRTRAVKLLKF